MAEIDRSYTPTTWVNHYEDPVTGEVLQQGTDVDEQHLNNIEKGIVDAHAKADDALAGLKTKAEGNHNHNTQYSGINHTHTAQDVGASPANHNHDGRYATAAQGTTADNAVPKGGGEMWGALRVTPTTWNDWSQVRNVSVRPKGAAYPGSGEGAANGSFVFFYK